MDAIKRSRQWVGGRGGLDGGGTTNVEIRGTALLSVTIEELGIKRPFSSLSPPPLPSPRATHFPSSSPPIPHPSCVVSFVSSPRHFHSAIVNQRDDDNNNASTFSTSKEQGYNERRRAITILAYVSSAELKKRVFFSFLSLPFSTSFSSSLLSLITELLCRVHSFLEHESDTSRSRTLFPSKKISRAL